MSRLWLAFALSLAFIAVACGGGSSAGPATPAGTAVTTGPAASGPSSAPATLYGVSLSPRSFQGDGFTSFFDDAKQVGEVVGWYGDWAQLGDKSASPAAVAQLASRYGYTPLFIANLYDEQTGVLRPLDAANLQAYKDAAAAFARQYKPAYLGFGIEVNVLWERWPDDFEKFVNLFSETYDIVKAASPQTRVFTVFQLERMKGLQGGLFGGKNDATQA
jgi:hypothetical protein